MRFAIVVVVLAACSSGTKTAESPAAEEHTSCTADADCVIVETACCDHCNGGKAEAFNRAFAEQHRPTGCENTACTLRGCGEAIASCEGGSCTVTIAPL